MYAPPRKPAGTWREIAGMFVLGAVFAVLAVIIFVEIARPR